MATDEKRKFLGDQIGKVNEWGPEGWALNLTPRSRIFAQTKHHKTKNAKLYKVKISGCKFMQKGYDET